MTIQEIEQQIIDEFANFDEWLDKYSYLIELGKDCPVIDEKDKTESNLIKGCQSRVWVGTEMDDGKLIIHADSDSLITKGLIALFIRLLSGLTPAEILAADLGRLDDCGLKEHLASTRANALTSMAATIRKAADTAAKTFLL